MDINNLTMILQASIAPCVLISGLGLLVLSMTNRLARPIERIRLLCHELRRANDNEKVFLREQINILYKRCHILQRALALTTASIFFLSIIILTLFTMHVFTLNFTFVVEWFFAISLICLISSVLFFMQDIRMSLHSVKIEMENSTTNTKVLN